MCWVRYYVQYDVVLWSMMFKIHGQSKALVWHVKFVEFGLSGWFGDLFLPQKHGKTNSTTWYFELKGHLNVVEIFRVEDVAITFLSPSSSWLGESAFSTIATQTPRLDVLMTTMSISVMIRIWGTNESCSGIHTTQTQERERQGRCIYDVFGDDKDSSKRGSTFLLACSQTKRMIMEKYRNPVSEV